MVMQTSDLSPLSSSSSHPQVFWQVCSGKCSPSFPSGHHCYFPFGVAPPEASAQQVGRPEESPPSAPPRSEESAPTTLGLGPGKKTAGTQHPPPQVPQGQEIPCGGPQAP
ncbi:Transmembrane protein 245 [Dissostichus eleginoides]|uniref:Transmembrane protein 245 n=1 Tax=Dissostichus eleginoides TaxID=100907 RepID=A0AAD9BZR2_DISEL|nr:Transmembrane protein 245 [Dissostichus eleginoides]